MRSRGGPGGGARGERKPAQRPGPRKDTTGQRPVPQKGRTGARPVPQNEPRNELHGSISGRAAAAAAVVRVLTRRSFVSDELAWLRAEQGIAGRDAAQAMDLALGAVRHWITIEQALSRVANYDPRRVSPAVRAILLTAGYEAIWRTDSPLFAVVDEFVSLAKRAGRAGAPASRKGADARVAGLVNAILRQLCRAIAARATAWVQNDASQIRTHWDQGCQFNCDVLPRGGGASESTEHLAAAAGLPVDLLRGWVERYGRDAAQRAAWASQAVPSITVHRNPLRASSSEFIAGLREAFGEACEMTRSGTFLPARAHLADLGLFRAGGAYVQDATARQSALLLGPRSGERVLDLCAAPGGKSITLALAMEDRGEVVACDVDRRRMRHIHENLERLGLTCIRTLRLVDPAARQSAARLEGGRGVAGVPLGPLVGGATGDEGIGAGSFDAAIVDAPCSNTGVLARRPEARHAFSPRRLASLTQLQAHLLRSAADAVRSGGRLVYCTCSIQPEENERVVAAFLHERPEWQLDAEVVTLPQAGPRLSDWRDGGYAVRLLRR